MKLLSELLPAEECLATKVPASTPVLSLAPNSQDIGDGALFVAVAGTKTDGHQFVSDAAKKAAVVVVEQPQVFEANPRTVLVRSTREALAKLCSRWWGEPSRAFQLVGVTGTNGKTTTTYLLNEIWKKSGKKSGLLGTVSYQTGTEVKNSSLTTPGPLELQPLLAGMRDSGITQAAMEVSSIALDQVRVGGTQFRAAIFTNLTQDHLDYHGTLEAYYEAKRKLFTEYGVPAAVLNADDPWGRRLFTECPSPQRFLFSLQDSSADFFLSAVRFERHGMTGLLHSPQGTWKFSTPLLGKHNLSNCLAAIAAAYALGTEVQISVAALSTAEGAPGRLQRVAASAGRPNVFVDYAHSADALDNVLRSLAELKTSFGGRILTVFGCGGDRDRTKRPKMAKAVSLLSDVTIATSDNPRTEDPNQILDEVELGIERSQTAYYREVNRRRAIRLALSMAHPHDIVLIAGKGHETYQILGTDTIPFDDRAEVRAFFDEPERN